MASSRSLPVIGISLGDPCGIGPEVTAAALRDRRVRRALVPVVFGDVAFAPLLPPRLVVSAQVPPPAVLSKSGGALVTVGALGPRELRPGKPTRAGGAAQYAYVRAVIGAAQSGLVQAICTAPVSKEQISRAGVPFMGHTEVLAEAFAVEVLMLMAGPRVRVALATNHLPLAAVPGALSVEGLVAQLGLLSRGVRPLVGRRPRLAVCGLNPHAGEGGLLGREEVEVISPAIALARRKGLDVKGPLPADGLFAKAGRLPFDAVLAMYHDQGLVAAKALDFELTVNVTLGLPLPRTSPDHGVAYDLAGKGRASAEPMIAALLQAAALAALPRRTG